MKPLPVFGLVALALAGCDPQPLDVPEPDPGGIRPPRPAVPVPAPVGGLDPEPGMDLYCDAASVAIDDRPADVVLVLDKSRSMLTRWDHDRDPATPTVTRWSSLHGVVEGIVGEFDERLSLGAVMFPAVEVATSTGGQACYVDAEPDAAVASQGGAGVLAAMPPAHSLDIQGATPATAAIDVAARHLADIADGRPQAIVLVTDGAANCSADADASQLGSMYDARLEATVAEIAASGVVVYVIGVDIVDDVVTSPTVDPFEALSAVAQAGGVPRAGDVPFFDALDEASLAAALREIVAELGCSVEADADGPSSLLQVVVGGAPRPGTLDCALDPTGWRRATGSRTRIELCPQACAAFHDGAAIEVTYACFPEE